MPHSRGSRGPWSIVEQSEKFRVLDGAGVVLAEIAFGPKTNSALSRADAHHMALKMVEAGKALATASAGPVPKTAARRPADKKPAVMTRTPEKAT